MSQSIIILKSVPNLNTSVVSDCVVEGLTPSQNLIKPNLMGEMLQAVHLKPRSRLPEVKVL